MLNSSPSQAQEAKLVLVNDDVIQNSTVAQSVAGIASDLHQLLVNLGKANP